MKLPPLPFFGTISWYLTGITTEFCKKLPPVILFLEYICRNETSPSPFFWNHFLVRGVCKKTFAHILSPCDRGGIGSLSQSHDRSKMSKCLNYNFLERLNLLEHDSNMIPEYSWLLKTSIFIPQSRVSQNPPCGLLALFQPGLLFGFSALYEP